MRLRRHAVTLALVGLSCALSVYLFVFDRGAVSTGEAESRQHNVFAAFRRADLSRIDLMQGDSSMALVRRFDDGGNALYELERPSGTPPTEGDPSGDAGAGATVLPADMGAVSKLLSELELAVRDRSLDSVSNAAELHALGLDAPRIRVTLQMGHLSYELSVGGAAPLPAGAAYARLKGKARPFVIRRELVQQLQEPPDSYRSKALVPYLASDIAEFEIRGAGAPRHLRWFDHQLRIETPDGWVRAERGAVERFVSSLADLRAESFVDPKEAEKILSSAGERLTLELTPRAGGRPKAVIDIAGPCPGQPGRRLASLATPGPRVDACVPEEAWEPLSVPMGRFVDLHLFSLHPDETEQMVLRSGDRRLELARLGTSWHMRAPNDTTVDADTGNALARNLTEMVGSEIVPTSGAGPFVAKGEVVLTATGSAPLPDASGSTGAPSEANVASTHVAPHKVEVGESNADGFVLVRRADDGVFLKLRSGLARALFPSPSAVRSRTVLDARLADTRRVRVDLDNVRQTLVRTSAGAWSLEEPKGFAVDPGVANDIAESLVNLRAERWVSDSDDGSYGWAAHHGRIEIDIAPSSVTADPAPPGATPAPARESPSADAESIATVPSAGPSEVTAAKSTAKSDPNPRGGRQGPTEQSYAITLGGPTAGGRFAKLNGELGVFVLPTSVERAVSTWGIDRSAFLLDLSGARELFIRRGRDRFLFRVADDEVQRTPSAQAERLATVRDALADLRAEAAVHTGAPRKDEGFDKPRLDVWLERPKETGRQHNVHIEVGAGDVWHGMNVFYARRDGVNATFVVAQSRLKPLLELR